MENNNSTLLVFRDDAYIKYLILDKKDQKMHDLFWLGFMIYTVAFAVSQTTMVSWILCQAFQLLGLGMILVGAFSQLRFTFDSLSFKHLYVLYMAWLAFVVVRGLATDYDGIKAMLFDASFGLFPYFVPLIVLFPRNLLFYKRLFDVIFIFGLAFLAISAVFIKQIIIADNENLISKGIVEVFTRTMGMTTGFILLTFVYHTKKRNLLSIFILFVIMLMAIYKGRRGLLIMSVLPLMVAYFFYLFESKAKILVVLISVLVGGVLLVYGMSFLEKSSLFNTLKDRGLEDTRSSVEACFYDDMTFKDWVIGRGMRGEYYCPGIDIGSGSKYRYVIETDYLQIMLKGGIISFGLLLLITIPAAFLGLFRSKNLLSKAAGAWIILALINMYPSTVNTFSINYLIVWISVGIGYSKAIRDLPELVLKKYFS